MRDFSGRGVRAADRPLSAPYQSLRRGGITGHGTCGTIMAGQLLLGEFLGDPAPAGAVTPALVEASIQSMEELHHALFDRALGAVPGQATDRTRIRARQSRRGLLTAVVAGAAVAGGLVFAAISP